MDKIKVETAKLFSQLKANREKHIKEFNELFSQYKITAKNVLLERAAEIDKWEKPEYLHFDLDVPENHTEDYDLAISMLEWSTDSFIELDARTFRRYVLDEWDWRETFENTKLSYRK